MGLVCCYLILHTRSRHVEHYSLNDLPQFKQKGEALSLYVNLYLTAHDVFHGLALPDDFGFTIDDHNFCRS